MVLAFGLTRLAALFAVAGSIAVAQVRASNPATLHKPAGYSHIVEATGGKTVYIAGQVALNPAGELVGAGDFEAQVRQVFANLKLAAEAAGGTFKDIVKLNYYCADTVDRAQLPALRRIRDGYVDTEHPPASTLVFVRGLARAEFLIEVEAIAVVERRGK